MDMKIKFLETGKIGGIIAQEKLKKIAQYKYFFFRAESVSSSLENEGGGTSNSSCALGFQKV